MGGKGSGGYRVGAGRKRKDLALGELTGSRRTKARAASANQTVNQSQPAADAPQLPAGAPPPAAVPMAPGYLTLEELAEWQELAPLAVRQGTLTDVEVPALVDLCRERVLLVKLLRAVDRDGFTQVGSGGTVAANPLIARYTTLQQRVDAGMLRFGLAPAGRETGKTPEQPADPFDQFDGPAAGVAASVN